MKKLISLFAFCALFSAEAQKIDSEVFDNYLTNLESEGLSVLVAQGGQTIYTKTLGFANREHKVPNTYNTKFQIGSMTKQFTAMGIMILRDQCKIKLNDSIGMYLKDCPQTWKEITIHELLTHTSGLMHSWEHPNFRKIMASPISLDETINLFKEHPMRAQRGAVWRYSGLGYFILAKIIELESEMSWSDFLDQEIFDKLNMKDTGVTNHVDVIQNLASGYYEVNGHYLQAPHIYLPILTGGGDLHSTLDDLKKWYSALCHKKLISEESYKIMFTPEKSNYAYGWFVDKYKGEERIHHSGGVPGFVSNIVLYPNHEMVVVIFSNATTTSAKFLQEFPSLVFDALHVK